MCDRLPGENMLGLKRISKIMSLTEPTALQASLTALVALESPATGKTITYGFSVEARSF